VHSLRYRATDAAGDLSSLQSMNGCSGERRIVPVREVPGRSGWSPASPEQKRFGERSACPAPAHLFGIAGVTQRRAIVDSKTIFLLTIVYAQCVNASQHTSASFLKLEFRQCNGQTTLEARITMVLLRESPNTRPHGDTLTQKEAFLGSL
jgi:hypothetical protein